MSETHRRFDGEKNGTLKSFRHWINCSNVARQALLSAD